MAAKKQHLHFFGISGHAMRGLALAARNLGYEITGTDPGAKPPGSTWLDEQGITWYSEADSKHLKGVDMVVMSGGTAVDDVELAAAQKQKLPIKSYAAFVGEIIGDKHRIVVAGTHGKTTTTSFITWLLESAGEKPDYLIGITPRNFDTSVRLGDGKTVVLEGDEYKASSIDTTSKFMFYKPDVLVMTSLEMDHPDLFKDKADIQGRFEALVKAMPKSGHIFYWAGEPTLAKVINVAQASTESYGEGGDWHAEHVQYTPTGLALDLYYQDVYKGHFRVGLHGRHNVDNAVAALAVGLRENLDAHLLEQGCETFLGAARRFTLISSPEAQIRVIDDYAHHPTEIATTIDAAKRHFGGRVIAIVQPHTYSRVEELLDGYRSSAASADIAFIAPIESARETGKQHTVSGADIANDNGDHVFYEEDRAKLVGRVVAEAKPGDTIVSMTVGEYQGLAQELADKTASKS